jgi:hypothetical protein
MEGARAEDVTAKPDRESPAGSSEEGARYLQAPRAPRYRSQTCRHMAMSAVA